MEKVREVSRNRTNAATKARRLPEIPKDQEPYDVTNPPPKPPRLLRRSRRISNPDLQRSTSRLHTRSTSLTDSQVGFGEDTRSRGTQNGNLIREKSVSCEFAGQNARAPTGNRVTFSSDVNGDSVPSETSNHQRLPIPVFGGKDVMFSRCTTCHQRIFIESETYLIAQSQLFHSACFCCAICNGRLDVTDYCFMTDHEKFYCVQHYSQVSNAVQGIGNERMSMKGTGPGSLMVTVFADGNCHSPRRRRKQIVKKLVELQHRRTMLEKFGLQLREMITNATGDERCLLWKRWFDVTYEKTMIMKGVTELAYKLKEGELCEEQEEIQKRLQRLKKQRDDGCREKYLKQEEKLLQSVLDVIEKRDLLLLELEIERRRDDDEVQRLKCKLKQSDNFQESCPSENAHRDKSCGLLPNDRGIQIAEECSIL